MAAPTFTPVNNTIPNANGNGVGQSYQTDDLAATAAKNLSTALADQNNPNLAINKNQAPDVYGNVRKTGVPSEGNNAYVPSTSAAVVTPKAATQDVSGIQSFLTTTKNNMAAMAANATAKGQTPTMSGYTVGTTKTGAAGEIPMNANGLTYYAVPEKPNLSADDIKNMLSGAAETAPKTDTIVPPAGSTVATTASAGSTAAGSVDADAETAGFSSQTKQILSDTESAYQNFNAAVTQIRTGVFPLSASQQALLDSTKSAFTSLLANEDLKAAALSSETGGFSNKVSATVGEMANIQSQQAGAIAKLEQGFQDDNYKYIKDSYDEFQNLETKKTEALTTLHNAVMDQYKTALAEKNKIQDGIDKIAEDAAKNGATKATIAAINGAKSVSEAINAAGDSLQTGTGQVGDYLMYKRDAEANGLVPQDYSSWKDADDAKQTKKKYAEAYATEAGKNAADNAGGDGSGNNYGNNKVQNALEQQFRAVLEKEFSARSGTYGLNDSKVSQANKLAVLFNQAYDPKTGNYNLNSQQYGELAEGLAALVSGSPGGASDADVAALRTATAKGDWNKVYTYVTGSPANGSSQAIINSLATSVEREAQQAVKDRQVDQDKIEGLAPTGLDPARAAKLTQAESIPYIGISGIAKGNVNGYIKTNASYKLPNGSTLGDAVAQMYEQPGATDENVWQTLESLQASGAIPSAELAPDKNAAIRTASNGYFKGQIWK